MISRKVDRVKVKLGLQGTPSQTCKIKDAAREEARGSGQREGESICNELSKIQKLKRWVPEGKAARLGWAEEATVRMKSRTCALSQQWGGRGTVHAWTRGDHRGGRRGQGGSVSKSQAVLGPRPHEDSAPFHLEPAWSLSHLGSVGGLPRTHRDVGATWVWTGPHGESPAACRLGDPARPTRCSLPAWAERCAGFSLRSGL